MRLQEQARTLIAALVVAALLSACTAPAQEPTPTGAQFASRAAAAPLSPTTVRISPEVSLDVTEVYGAGYTSAVRPGRDVALPTVADTAALLVATTDTGEFLTGIAITSTRFERVPVVLDYQETAFASLLALPTWATQSPQLIIVLRALAERSTHLSGLARAIEQQDATAVDAEQGALSQDMADLALTFIPPTLTTQGVTLTAHQVAAAPHQESDPAKVAAELSCSQSDPASATPDGIGLCASYDLENGIPQGNDLTPVDLVNYSRSWIATFDPAVETTMSLPTSLTPPAVQGGILLADIVDNYTQMLEGLGMKALCAAAARFGAKCTDDFAQDAQDKVDALFQMEIDSAGGSVMYTGQAAGSARTVAISAGQAPGTALAGSASTASAQVMLAALNVWTMYVQPVTGLLAGARASNDAGRKISGRGPAGAHISSDSAESTARHEQLKGIYDALQGALTYNDVKPLLDTTSAGDASATGDVLLTIGTKITDDPAAMQALVEASFGWDLQGAIDEAAEALLARVGKKTLIKLIPYVGQAVAVADLAIAGFSAEAQIGRYFDQVMSLPQSADLPPMWWAVLRTNADATIEAANAAITTSDLPNLSVQVAPKAAAALNVSPGRHTFTAGEMSGPAPDDTTATVLLQTAADPVVLAVADGRSRALWLLLTRDLLDTGTGELFDDPVNVCRVYVAYLELELTATDAVCDSATEAGPTDQPDTQSLLGGYTHYQWAAVESVLHERRAPQGYDWAVKDSETPGQHEAATTMGYDNAALGYDERTFTPTAGGAIDVATLASSHGRGVIFPDRMIRSLEPTQFGWPAMEYPWCGPGMFTLLAGSCPG